MQFSRLGSSKMELSETDFFDTLTIQNHQISYVKHVLAPLYAFFTLFGCWGEGGLRRGLGHNLLMQFFRLGSSKMENFKTDFFDNLTIQDDQISYAKHVVAPLYAFFTLFGCWGGGGGAPKGSRAQPTYAAFPPEQLKKRLSLSPLRGALPKAIEFWNGKIWHHKSVPNYTTAFKPVFQVSLLALLGLCPALCSVGTMTAIVQKPSQITPSLQEMTATNQSPPPKKPTIHGLCLFMCRNLGIFCYTLPNFLRTRFLPSQFRCILHFSSPGWFAHSVWVWIGCVLCAVGVVCILFVV